MKRALLLAIVVATAGAAVLPTSTPVAAQSEAPIADAGPRVAWDAEITDTGDWRITVSATLSTSDAVQIAFYKQEGDSPDPNNDPLIRDFEFQAGGTSTATWDSGTDAGAPKFGKNEWYVVVDDFNTTMTSQTFTTTIPGIEVREEATNEPITSGTTVNGTVTTQAGVSTEASVRTVNGTEVLPLTTEVLSEDLTPLNGAMTVDFRYVSGSPTYGDRTVSYSQPRVEQAWLPGGSTSDEVVATFEITDRTGNFPPESTVLQMTTTIAGEQKQITGDLFGTDGRLKVSLTAGERYNVQIVNSEGDTRTFGQYFADTKDDFVNIEIGEIPIGVDEAEGPLFQAYETTGFAVTGGLKVEVPAIKFRYLDPAKLTEELTVRIYQQNNESNQIYENTFASANEVQSQINTSEIGEDKSWIVEYEAVRANGTATGKEIVGGLGELEAPLDGEVLQSVALGSLLLVAGLFGGRLSRIGGVVVVAIAWVLVTIGWLAMPVEFLVAASVIAVLFHAAGGSMRRVPA